MNCPRDNQSLIAKEHFGYRVAACPSCKGMLVNAKVLPKQVANMGASNSVLAHSDISCKACRTTMQTFNYRGVDLDICSGCSQIWLDRGEEEKILSRNKGSWADGIDPISPVLDSFGSSSKADIGSCVADGADVSVILDFVGEAIGHLLDGF